MAWDPSVLKKYGTTSHFRLLNQVRTELRSNPLSRNKDGELNLGMGRRGYRVPVEVRSSGSSGSSSKTDRSLPVVSVASSTEDGSDNISFRDRLRAIQMR